MTVDWVAPAGRDSGLEVSSGHAVDWHRPGLPQFTPEQPHAYASLEVTAAPTLAEITSTPGQPVWSMMRGAALDLLSTGALMPGCASFEVRYVSVPEPGQPKRVRMFVSAMTRDWHPGIAQAAVSMACARLPAGFTSSTPESAVGLTLPRHRPDSLILELRRDEVVTEPIWDYIPSEFYYSIADHVGDASGWPGFWRALTRAEGAVEVSILAQQTDLDPTERSVIGSIMTDLQRFAVEHTEYDHFRNPIVFPACANAKQALDHWQQRVDALNRPLLTRLAVRGEPMAAASVATALAAAVGSSETLESHAMYVEPARSPSEVRQADHSFDWLEIMPWGGHGIWDFEGAPKSLRRMPYLMGLHEASAALVLPVPDEQGVAGMPRPRRLDSHRAIVQQSEAAVRSLQLGRSVHLGQAGSRVDLPLSAVNRHVLVVGAPGSGKTTTALTLLAQLWRDHQVPFAAIESVKTEYRSLLHVDGMKLLQVVTLGNESIAPLRLNPLEPPPGVRCEVHMSSVLASLKLALPLPPPLPQLLDTAIAQTYWDVGWDDDMTSDDGVVPPTLSQLAATFQRVFHSRGYRGDALNVGVAFQTRLEGLLRGSRGRMFDTVRSSDFTALLGGPVVFEMADIADADERALIAAFILARVRAEAVRRGSSEGRLVHVTLIEEAHRLLGKGDAGRTDPESGASTRSESVRAFCEAIAELRSSGEGFILSSQSPSSLAEAAVSNTGTRILHRVESAADRKILLDDLDADERLRGISARLAQGEAVVRWPSRDEADVVVVAAGDGIDSGRVTRDDDLKTIMAPAREAATQILPYSSCAATMCPRGCEARVRRRGRGVAADAERLLEVSPESRGREQLGHRAAETLADLSHGDAQLAYCGSVHLGLSGRAFHPRPDEDVRATTIGAIMKAVVRHGIG